MVCRRCNNDPTFMSRLTNLPVFVKSGSYDRKKDTVLIRRNFEEDWFSFPMKNLSGDKKALIVTIGEAKNP